MMWDNMRRVEREFNISIRSPVVAWDQLYPRLATSVRAGSPVGDLVRLHGSATFQAIISEVIMPAGQFTTAESDLLSLHRWVVPQTIMDGQIWSFRRNEPLVEVQALGVNLNIIEDIGAESPVSLWERGAWDWQAMREIMLMATRDLDGDGEIDQFGISGDPNQIFLNLVGANDGVLVNPDNDRGYVRIAGFDPGIAIPVGVNNPADVYMVYEQIASWPGSETRLLWESEFEGTRGAFLTEGCVERVAHAGENFKFDIGMVIADFPWVFGWLASEFWHGTMTVSSAIEGTRPSRQDLIDTAFAGRQ
jgi:hypothetical protein